MTRVRVGGVEYPRKVTSYLSIYSLFARAMLIYGRGPGARAPPPMDGPSCMVLNDARPPPLWGGPGGLGAGLQEKVVKFLRKY